MSKIDFQLRAASDPFRLLRHLLWSPARAQHELGDKTTALAVDKKKRAGSERDRASLAGSQKRKMDEASLGLKKPDKRE